MIFYVLVDRYYLHHVTMCFVSQSDPQDFSSGARKNLLFSQFLLSYQKGVSKTLHIASETMPFIFFLSMDLETLRDFGVVFIRSRLTTLFCSSYLQGSINMHQATLKTSRFLIMFLYIRFPDKKQ